MTVQFETPSAFLARDEFDQTAGALTGKTLPSAGTWAAGTGSDTDDFSVETTGKTAQRTAVSDTGGSGTGPSFNDYGTTGRYMLAHTTTYTAIAVQVDAKASIAAGAFNALHSMVTARYVDQNNWLQAGIGAHVSPLPEVLVSPGLLVVRKRVAGTVSWLHHGGEIGTQMRANTWYRMRLQVDARGRWFFWYGVASSPLLQLIAQGYDADLATGGALASGRIGFYDTATLGAATTRNYDNFLAFAPTPDAAIFA